jgi:hypothetical protein
VVQKSYEIQCPPFLQGCEKCQHFPADHLRIRTAELRLECRNYVS